VKSGAKARLAVHVVVEPLRHDLSTDVAPLRIA
jgi:hypothetical protein